MPFADFSPDFTLNSHIWLFYAEKRIFLKKLGTLLNVISQHKRQKWTLPVDNFHFTVEVSSCGVIRKIRWIVYI